MMMMIVITYTFIMLVDLLILSQRSSQCFWISLHLCGDVWFWNSVMRLKSEPFVGVLSQHSHRSHDGCPHLFVHVCPSLMIRKKKVETRASSMGHYVAGSTPIWRKGHSGPPDQGLLPQPKIDMELASDGLVWRRQTSHSRVHNVWECMVLWVNPCPNRLV